MGKKREGTFLVMAESRQSAASADYISFQAAYDRLNKEFQATKEEIALWTFFGRKLGGLTAYADNKPYPKACSILNRWKPPLPEDCADTQCGRCQSLYIAPRVFEMGDALNEAVDTNAADLMSDCYFLREAIEQFEPNRAGRYITGAELLERWKTFGLNEAEIKNKVHGRIAADELEDAHPIFGCYSFGSEGIPFERAMFPRAQIETIELRDFGKVAEKTVPDGFAEAVTGIPERKTAETPNERAIRFAKMRNSGMSGAKIGKLEGGISVTQANNICRKGLALLHKNAGQATSMYGQLAAQGVAIKKPKTKAR